MVDHPCLRRHVPHEENIVTVGKSDRIKQHWPELGEADVMYQCGNKRHEDENGRKPNLARLPEEKGKGKIFK
jgi:hypothetical protein